MKQKATSSQGNIFLRIILIIVVLLIGIGFFLWFYFIRGLKVTVQPVQPVFHANQYVEIEATLTNVASQPKQTLWGTCGENYRLFVDDKEMVKEHEVACPAIYFDNSIRPGERQTRKFQLNFSKVPAGKHSFYMIWENIRSNTVQFEITKEGAVADCYSYIKDITPLCKQIVIHTNISSADASDNAARCQRIKKRFIDGTKLQPITKLSTTACDGTKDAYFIMNVPESEFDLYRSKLAQVGDDAEILTNSTYLDIPEIHLN